MPKWFGVPVLHGWLRILLSALLLAGCAAQQAYNDGKELVAQGKVEQGLAKFQEAQAHDPHDVKYRQAYLQTRERATASFVEQGDRVAVAGDEDAARKLYQRALAIAPNNDKARAGLERLDAGSRNAALLKEADLAWAKKDIDGVRQRADSVLATDPANAHALTMKRAIDDKLAAQSSDAALAKAYRKTISIEFKDVALKQIFEVISRTSGLNFLFDKDVKTDQKASIFLKNSSIEAAVHYILLTNQLEQRVLDANTVLIYPSTAAKQKDYQEMAVRAFFLTNIEAKTMANTIKTIIKSRDIVVDDKLNMIMIRDTPEAIKVAERLVALQDVAEPEVMLEVEVLEVQKTLLQNLGVGWPASLSVTPLPLGTNLANGSTSTGTTTTTGTTSTSSTLSLNDLLHQNRNSLGVTVGQASVNANLQDSDAKLLTNPRIRVRNHEKAKILIGERVPNITSTATSTGFVSQSINYIDVGLTLNVEPTIYLDDDVAIKVTLEVSSILNQFTTSSGTSAYEIGTRTASTVLQLKNGETDVLAGLIDNSESHSGNKIPGIGDFPILGRLFGSATDNDSKTEIVLSITPHLIRNIQRPNVNEANFRSGTDSVMHSGPETDGVTVPTTASTPALPGIAIGGNVVETPVASTGTAQLQWQGPSQVAVGNTVQVALLMQATQGVDSVPLTLGFDAGKLQVVGVSEGPFLRQGGSPTSFSSRIGSGNITIADTSSSSTGATAQAVVATVTFRALAPTSATEVRLLSAAPLSVSGTPITVAASAPLTLQVVQP